MTKKQAAELAAYKRSNKDRKKVLLAKMGYKTQEEYFDAIGATKKKKTPTKVKATKVKISKPAKKHKIHNVFIMDDSGSMSGSKYKNGVEGIKLLVEGIKADNLTENTISIVDLNRGVVFWMSDPKNVNYEGHTKLMSTPLYRTIGKTIEDLLKSVGKKDKVLLNITTDGQDTEGFGPYTNLPTTLKKVQEENNFTVTFVGTEHDVRYIQDHLNVDASNTLVHDNTAAGMQKAFMTTNSARSTYSTSVSQGLDVSVGFYEKKVGTL